MTTPKLLAPFSRAAGVMLAAAVLLASPFSRAQTPPSVAPAEEQNPMAAFAWQTDGAGKLGTRAEIEIPSGFRFLPSAEASKLIEALGNISSKRELGLIGTDELEWFVVFYFDDVGYVKDDEKDQLDADKLAANLRDRLQQSNEIRRDRGIEELHFDGWALAPRYNEDSKQLEWASRLRSKGGVSVNYNTRVLGRKGVMRVILVTDPDALDVVLPQYQILMNGFRYVDGERYAEYTQGDKIAQYGLMALVAGGATAVAAKTGLLAGLLLAAKKFGKFILLGLAAVGAAIAKLFSRKSD